MEIRTRVAIHLPNLGGPFPCGIVTADFDTRRDAERAVLLLRTVDPGAVTISMDELVTALGPEDAQ